MTGAVEVQLEALEILNEAHNLPFSLEHKAPPVSLGYLASVQLIIACSTHEVFTFISCIVQVFQYTAWDWDSVLQVTNWVGPENETMGYKREIKQISAGHFLFSPILLDPKVPYSANNTFSVLHLSQICVARNMRSPGHRSPRQVTREM